MELKITKSSHQDYVSIAIRGEIDLYTAPRLHSELISALDSAGRRRLVVNMSQVEFCDSTGINVLLSGMKRARELGGDLELLAPCTTVQKVLEVTGLDAVFVVHSSEQSVPLAAASQAAD